jgi:hypothetical protein
MLLANQNEKAIFHEKIQNRFTVEIVKYAIRQSHLNKPWKGGRCAGLEEGIQGRSILWLTQRSVLVTLSSL